MVFAPSELEQAIEILVNLRGDMRNRGQAKQQAAPQAKKQERPSVKVIPDDAPPNGVAHDQEDEVLESELITYDNRDFFQLIDVQGEQWLRPVNVEA